MKKLILVLMVIFTLSSCESEEKVKSQITILKEQRAEIQSQFDKTVLMTNENISEIKKQHEILKEMKIEVAGRVPIYIIKFKLKQSHFSLDIGKHMKDAMNSIEFELPVDKQFYHSVKIGTNVVDDFRMGSAVMYGSLGSWKMKVVEKRISDSK